MSSFRKSSSNNNTGNTTAASSSLRPRVLDKVWNSFRNNGRNVATTTTTDRGAVVVGTQALALQRMETNRDRFKYPKEGFVAPIEHSLLYAMICEPKIYPEDVVLEQIANEDFESHLEIIIANDDETANNNNNSDNNNNSNNNSNNHNHERTSYAQLSAMLAESAEQFPDVKPQHDDEDDDAYGDQQHKEQQQRIPQALCKAVLSCVTKYADRHDLDRATEVKELLEPVEGYMMGRTAHTLLPIYIAYSVGLFIPGGIGVGLTLVSLSAFIAASDKADKNATTVQKMNSQRLRVADMETAGLLDEVEED
jgi:hypothetical protein